jgi:hypothetical protein
MDSGYFETGNQVHSSMIIPGILQTAELKASLESKIAMLTEKIKELTSHPLEGMEFEFIATCFTLKIGLPPATGTFCPISAQIY